ncbi:hypothetical protein [Microcoleus sp. AT8-A4]|uniref:hypothetical protein n=1 Tax=Microcoleus sp. AT8-A4 TaxID=2818615 RepID=UPI002FD2A1CD
MVIGNELIGTEILHPFQQQARCLFHKKINIFVEQAPFSATGKMPVPQENQYLCGTGILPVHKRLIENGAISQLE